MKIKNPQHLRPHLQPLDLLISGFDILQLAIRMILPVLSEYKGCMIS